METKGSIVVLDFGGQYAHLIASRVRRCGAFSEIREAETPAEKLQDAAGLILSGGPQSVYDEGSPQADPKILGLGIPVLGLCYGLHWMTQTLGGEVKQGEVKEYGRTEIRIVDHGGELLRDCGSRCMVWMSHGDEAVSLPPGFKKTAASEDCENAAFADEARRLFALQFHPEVTHTEHGTEILKRFVELCNAAPWSIESYAKHIAEQMKAEVGDRNVFMLVSGGVDSTVAFTLLSEVIGARRVRGLLVDTGLMRKGEVGQIREVFEHLGITNLHVEDASERFFTALRDVYDPEEKRNAIGEAFLEAQRGVARDNLLHGQKWMLGQGTIYPDTIETGATKHADTIKTHHNRIEIIQKMIDAGLVIEPLKDLYKDEVRCLGEELGLPHDLVWRHPFPGPGLGVRILCSDSACPVPRHQAFSWCGAQPERSDWYGDSDSDSGSGLGLGMGLKMPHAVLPVRSVGVQGDSRTYRHAVALFSEEPCEVTREHRKLATDIPNKYREINRVLLCTSQSDVPVLQCSSCFITRERADLLREADAIADEELRGANLYEDVWQFPVVLLPFGTSKGGQSVVLRPVESVDAMTADAFLLPKDVLRRMTRRIMELPGIDLVFLDLTSKPPATIEWE